jgi:hypothetical protein
MIYEHAAAESYESFPMLYKTPRSLPAATTTTTSKRKGVPYVALTQVCMQIRAEFRPMWLSTHRLPLSLTDAYFKAFFPAWTSRALARFKTHPNSIVAFRIWVRKGDMGTIFNTRDATRLLRHKARFPNCTITCQGNPLIIKDALLQNVERILNHSNPTWLKWVNKGRISQIRLGLDTDDTTVKLILVLKERFTEPWMKVLHLPDPEQFYKDVAEEALSRFGFHAHGNKNYTFLKFNVDYS